MLTGLFHIFADANVAGGDTGRRYPTAGVLASRKKLKCTQVQDGNNGITKKQ
jgi:hypothetical protein